MALLGAAAMGLDDLLSREWLVANGIGGFACSTPVGLNTRKYHGLLVAAMSPPVRRMVLLSRVEETVISVVGSGTTSQKRQTALACNEYPGTIHPHGHEHLRAFSDEPFPRWAYQGEGWTIEKSLRLLCGENTVCLTYTLLGAEKPVVLELRPLFALRGIHELCYQWTGQLDAQSRSPGQQRIPPTSRTPEVFFAHDGVFEPGGCWYMSTIYRRECERGYAGLEDLWMPGVVRYRLAPGQSVHFVCSSEPIELDRVLSEADRQAARELARSAPIVTGAADQALEALLRAADQFVLHLPKAVVSAGADAAMNVMASYPWSPPAGRDALIAFTGLLLIPGRFDEARHLLEAMAGLARDGVMPSEFPEDASPPKYFGADTSLWFVNAVHEWVRYTGDESLVRERLFETVVRIIRCYQSGTSLGIAMDPDGLLASHEPGVATTWMDARTGDWVVTPRQGRPVELNALWYNALRIAADLCARFDRLVWAGEFVRLAEAVRLAFNRRFWNESSGCCFDVIGDRGADPSIRPNQLLAISLPHAVLASDRWPRVLEVIRRDLLTPMGVRTLARSDPSYRGHYAGDVVSRDRAYHQGSAYPWLLGPMSSAVARVQGRTIQTRNEIRGMLEGCLMYLQDRGVGQICELFDGDPPHHPGGAIASARSVGQVLQAYVEEVLGVLPQARSGSPTRPSPVRPPVGA